MEAVLEEGSLEEEAPPMPQGNGPGGPQALDSTDLDVPTEAVTRESKGARELGWQHGRVTVENAVQMGWQKCSGCSWEPRQSWTWRVGNGEVPDMSLSFLGRAPRTGWLV